MDVAAVLSTNTHGLYDIQCEVTEDKDIIGHCKEVVGWSEVLLMDCGDVGFGAHEGMMRNFNCGVKYSALKLLERGASLPIDKMPEWLPVLDPITDFTLLGNTWVSVCRHEDKFVVAGYITVIGSSKNYPVMRTFLKDNEFLYEGEPDLFDTEEEARSALQEKTAFMKKDWEKYCGDWA